MPLAVCPPASDASLQVPRGCLLSRPSVTGRGRGRGGAVTVSPPSDLETPRAEPGAAALLEHRLIAGWALGSGEGG